MNARLDAEPAAEGSSRRRRRRQLFAALAAALLGSAACSELLPIEPRVCGNNVIENGEDCEHIGVAEADGFECGAVGTANECRWRCTPGQENGPSCPPGHGCGADGVCRLPIGALSSPQTLNIPPGSWLGSGDFDGDGTDDIAWAHGSYCRVDYMASGVSVGSVEVNQLQLGWPSIGDANEDGLADLLLPTVEGLAVHRGSASRTLNPTTFASTRFPLIAPVIVALDAVPEVVLPPNGPPQLFSGSEVLALTTGHIEVLLPQTLGAPAPLSGDLSQLAQPSIVGEFDETGDPALYPAAGPTPEELVIAFEGADHATLYRPSLSYPNGANAPPKLSLAALPPVQISTSGFPVARLLGAIHANPAVNGGSSSALPCGAGTVAPSDEHLDIALLTIRSDGGEDGPQYAIEVAFGIGDGRFHSDPCVLDQVPSAIAPDNTTTPFTLFTDCGDAMALGHLDQDGLLDVVTRRGIWQTRLLGVTPGDPLPSLCADGTPHLYPVDGSTSWREVVIADLNQDGAQDVVAAPEYGGLDLYLGSVAGPLTHDPRPGVALAHSLAPSDYDGDNCADVAFIEEVDGPDRISVLFGETFSTPGPVITVGALDGVTALLGFNRAASGNVLADNAQELGVQVNKPTSVDVATLYGRPDRQLQAPFTQTYLDASNVTVLATLAARVGHLDGGRQPQVALLACDHQSPAQFSIGAVNASGDLTFELIADRERLNASGSPAALGLELAVGDDGRENMVVVSSRADEERILVEVAEMPLAPNMASAPDIQLGAGSILLEGHTLDGADDAELLPASSYLAGKATAICDVGHPDGAALLIAAHTLEKCAGGSLAAGTSSLLLVGGGLLDDALSGTSHGLTDSAIFNAPSGSRMTGFACLNADTDPAMEIVLLVAPGLTGCGDGVATDDVSLWLLDFDANGNPRPATLWEAYSATSLGITVTPSSTLPAIYGLTGGDFNGDGVTDLAAGTNGATILWLSSPTIE